LQPFHQIIVKELLLFVVFVIPIFKWNLEPETVGYIQKNMEEMACKAVVTF
jgi:hypothetical protein